MNNFTPLKFSLISIQITPQKQLVNYEINSWMQTNQKRKVSSRLIKPQKITIPIKPSNISSLAILRQKRLDLLNDSNKKYSKNITPISIVSSKYELKTAATANTHSPFSIQSASRQLNSTQQKEVYAPIIQISEFKEQLPQFYSKKRLNELIRAKAGKNLRKFSAQIKSNVILKAKITQNTYKRMSQVTKMK